MMNICATNVGTMGVAFILDIVDVAGCNFFQVSAFVLVNESVVNVGYAT
jgi:hypothetical protein